MLRYVYDQSEAVAHAVAKTIPHLHGRPFGKCKAIGVIDEQGRMIAGLVYHNWLPEAGVINLSVAALPGTNWLSRETGWRMYAYPFIDADVQMVSHLVPADATHALRQLAMSGCMLIEIPRIFGRERDGVLGLLTREAWEDNKLHQRCARSAPRAQEEVRVMGGMYGGGMPQTAAQPMGAGAALAQNPDDVNAGRDRITQALMDVQNPPPITPMTQQSAMPPASGAPPMGSAMPAATAPQPMGQMAAGGGMLGQAQAPLVGQGGAMPGLMQQPQAMTQPGGSSPLMQPQTPAGGPTY